MNTPLSFNTSCPDDVQPDLYAEEAEMTEAAANAVTVQEQALPPAPAVNPIVTLIERVVSNPDVDVTKIEQLLAMQERMEDRAARTAYYEALAELQPKLPVIERKGRIVVPAKDGKSGHSTPYALWEDVNEAIRPHLAAHGFALSFRVKKEADRVEVTGVLSHRAGHAEETLLSLPMDSTGSKNNVQAIGSSVSYGKRYTAFALLNITSRGEDDDGEKAGESAFVAAAIAAIDACADRPAMKAWKAKNAQALDTADSADANKVITHFNERWSKLGVPA